ncbi:aspartic proteinase-like protein 2 isoform X2 [Fagus crenata]
MRPFIPFIFALAVVVVPVFYCVLLPLKRAFHLTHHGLQLDQHRARDRAKHARLLQGSLSGGGVVDFSLQGSYDPYVAGLYYTKVKLGSPPKEFNAQIDTGSDILWVSCNSCSDCPQSSALGIQLNFFDSASSSSAALLPCSDPMCTSEATSLIANSSATIVFGSGVGYRCSTYQSGSLTRPDQAVDGIFGFVQGELSVISQLSSRAITPKVFSHCLKGDGNGGGILVLGEILEPGIIYSPLVPSQPHHNLYLQSISINGQLLPIDPAAFATSDYRVTIVDSGTTLALLVAEAYDPFVSSITAYVQRSTTLTTLKGNHCYLVSTRFIFPPVSLNFAAGASMVLKPEGYLVQNHASFTPGGAEMWCIGFQRSQGLTVLGDLVLKDKILVYDLAHQRIGWANYDCSLSVNVSITSGKEFLNAGQLSASSELIPTSIMRLLMQMLLLKQFQFGNLNHRF